MKTGPIPFHKVLLLAGMFFFCLACASSAQQLIDAYDVYTTNRIRANTAADSGSFADALEQEQAALKAAEDNFGPYHPKTLLVYNDLGAIYRAMARYTEAEKAYQWVLAVREKTLGGDDPLIADALNNLAVLYEDLGRDREAEIAGEKALHIAGGENGVALESLILGNIQISLHNPLEAEKTLSQAVSLGEKAANNDPHVFGECLKALAQANQAAGHFSLAEARLQQCLDFCGKQYKADGPEVADVLESLGDFYRAQGGKKKSQDSYESALKIYKSYAGMGCSYPSAPYILKAADCFQATGDETTARKLREEVLVTLKESLGPDHPRVALCLVDLAGDDLVLGDKAGAQKKLGLALDILKRVLGNDHPLVLSVQNKLQRLNKGD